MGRTAMDALPHLLEKGFARLSPRKTSAPDAAFQIGNVRDTALLDDAANARAGAEDRPR